MTRALILAAGQGTRLRPITESMPKCLVPLLGVSLLERQVATLEAAGIDNIAVATGYRAKQIESLGFTCYTNPRYATTNMVESLFAAREHFSDEDLVIGYGDIVYEQKNLDKLLVSDAEIALMVDLDWRELWSCRLDEPLEDAETLKLGENMQILELGKKPESYDQIQGQYTGLIKVRSDKIADVAAFYDQLDRAAHYDGNDFANMYMTSFLQLMINSGFDVRAVPVHAGWLEIDSCDDLETYEAMAGSAELDRFYRSEY